VSKSMWPGVRSKSAKGRRYWYWTKVDKGTPWVRLPDPYNDPDAFMRKIAHLKRVSVNIEQRRREGTFGALATQYRLSKHYREKLAPNTRLAFDRYLDRLLVAYADAPLVEITPEDIQVRVMDANADTPSAADMMLSILRSLYKFAVKRQRGLQDWTLGVEQYNDHKDREPWPPALLEAALIDEDPLFRIAVTLALYTGQRPGDVCAMTWNAIGRDDAGNPTIRVRQQKTGTPLEIPMHPVLRAALAQTAKAGHLFILSNRRGGPLTAPMFNSWCRDWTRKNGGGHTPHGLRKNATNELFDAGCTTAQVASVTGHKSLRMLEHYGKGRSQKTLATAAVLNMWAPKTERERENSRAEGKPGR